MPYAVKIPSKVKYLVGVDEVGRGPLAGPLTVCAFCVPKSFSRSAFKGVKSSKKISSLKRLRWEKLLKNLIKEGRVKYSISSARSTIIDKKGISKTTKIAVERALEKLELNPKETFVLLDGLLKAPQKYQFQKTIIRGDEKVDLISCASILAKVKRDKMMVRLDKKYSLYGFSVHKGYGTKLHKRRIEKYGPCEIHRRIFLKDVKVY